jgi:tetratricopeptide (TPR) repeat protein
MLTFSKRFIYTLSNKIWQGLSSPEGKLVFNLSSPKKTPFNIKSELSYNANLSKGSLKLGIKKPNCIAWVDMPQREYQDHIIEAEFRLDSLGGYAAAGIIFRIMDDDSYYLALVSSKGYFRLDVVKDSNPKTLIAWTEISDFNGINISLKIITYGTSFIFIVNKKWLGEINDDTVAEGKLGFALASYSDSENEEQNTGKDGYICAAYLDFISADTRVKSIEEEYKKWSCDSNINAEGRLRLAETFAVMGDSGKAIEQIHRAWKRRDEVISAVAASEIRTKKELLLAARMTFSLGQYKESDEYINTILDQWADTPEGKLACAEKVKVLNELNRFEELKQFAQKYQDKINKDIDYYTMLARCHWELNEYAESAAAWDNAFKLNSENGVYAVNAANAHELAENKKEALVRYIEAGKIFLNQDNKPELAALMPKLDILGSRNWEARALAGKWAFSMEDYQKCVQEFNAANKIRCSLKPRPKADPAVFYLWGLVLNLYGRSKTAIRLLEKAVKLAPDYGLFRFKLAEIKLLTGAKDPAIADEFKLAFTHLDDPEGKMAEHAGNLLLNAGYAKSAKYFFELMKKD